MKNEEITNRVARLLVGARTGQLSAKEREELEAWLAADEVNRVFYERFMDVGRLEKDYRRLGEVETGRAMREMYRRIREARVRRRLTWWRGVAAAVVVGMVAGAGVWLWNGVGEDGRGKEHLMAKVERVTVGRPVLYTGDRVMVVDSVSMMAEGGATVNREDDGDGLVYRREGVSGETKAVVYHVLETPRGGEFQLTLEDGSRVWLNAGSRLRYPVAFGGEERRVELEGEAYFEVEHEEGRPFRVEVGGELVEVLGTAFDVKAYPGERRYTTLVSGRVKVRSDEGEEVVLAPGEWRVADDEGWRVEAVDVEKVTSWRTGMFVLEDQTLEEVMDQLGRWYSFTVFYRNEGLKEVVFKGKVPRYTTFEEILRVLEKTGGIHFGVEGSTVTVYN